MTTRTRFLMSLLAMAMTLLAVLACGDNTTGPGVTPELEAPTATPVAQAQGIFRVSLDDYLVTVCGESEMGVWEEGVSLRELSSGLEMITEQMEALDPPAEVSDWHHAQLAFQRTFKQTIDDYLEDSKDRSEDEFLLSMFSTLAPHFQPVDQAIAAMAPDIRARMATAGCIDEEAADSSPTEVESEVVNVPVGSRVDGSLDEPHEIDYFQFEGEIGKNYLIEVAWKDLPEMTVVVKDPFPRVEHYHMVDSDSSPLIVQWTAPESGAQNVDLYSGDATGSYTVSVSIDNTPDPPPGPDKPANVRYAQDDSTITVRWDPVEGAEYYKIYHDDFFDTGCSLDSDGSPEFCDELATLVAGSDYTHASPDPFRNYYWVVACNSDGCSEIDSDNPAALVADEASGDAAIDPAPTPAPDAPPTPAVAQPQETSRLSLEDYMAFCGGPDFEVGAWDENSLSEVSAGWGTIIGYLGSMEPPSEIADWHAAVLTFLKAARASVDEHLASGGGQSEDDYILNALFPLALQYQPQIDQAIGGMAPDVRAQMIAAGCIE